jgi:hypothetical protein
MFFYHEGTVLWSVVISGVQNFVNSLPVTLGWLWTIFSVCFTWCRVRAFIYIVANNKYFGMRITNRNYIWEMPASIHFRILYLPVSYLKIWTCRFVCGWNVGFHLKRRTDFGCLWVGGEENIWTLKVTREWIRLLNVLFREQCQGDKINGDEMGGTYVLYVCQKCGSEVSLREPRRR